MYLFIITSRNWKLGDCVRQWFHWTFHVIFVQKRLNFETESEHKYQFLADEMPLLLRNISWGMAD